MLDPFQQFLEEARYHIADLKEDMEAEAIALSRMIRWVDGDTLESMHCIIARILSIFAGRLAAQIG